MIQSYVVAEPKRPQSRLHVLQATNAVFFLLTVAFNYLSQAMPLHGKTTGELSDQYPNLFTPAPITFSIWGLIYLALLAFVIWQAWPIRNAQRAEQRNVSVSRLGWDFAGLCGLNMAWLFCWHYEFVSASVVVMLITLWLLLRMNSLIFRDLAHTTDNRNFLQIPFGLYLGWISVATVANITAWLVSRQWPGFGLSEPLWTEIMMTVAILLTIVVLFRWHNIPYSLSVIWALFGIALKHQHLFGLPLSSVNLTAYTGILLLLLVAGTRLRRWWNGALFGNVHTPLPTVY
ncbi:MAG: hypothetical protein ABIQ93_01340 [Saprospiraceae bacterium]